MSLPKTYTVDKVAEALNVSEYTVRRWLRAGDLEGSRSGRQWLVPEKAVSDYLTARSNVAVVRPTRKRRSA